MVRVGPEAGHTDLRGWVQCIKAVVSKGFQHVPETSKMEAASFFVQIVLCNLSVHSHRTSKFWARISMNSCLFSAMLRLLPVSSIIFQAGAGGAQVSGTQPPSPPPAWPLLSCTSGERSPAPGSRCFPPGSRQHEGSEGREGREVAKGVRGTKDARGVRSNGVRARGTWGARGAWEARGARRH